MLEKIHTFEVLTTGWTTRTLEVLSAISNQEVRVTRAITRGNPHKRTLINAQLQVGAILAGRNLVSIGEALVFNATRSLSRERICLIRNYNRH
jgi:hypothetical protein